MNFEKDWVRNFDHISILVWLGFELCTMFVLIMNKFLIMWNYLLHNYDALHVLSSVHPKMVAIATSVMN